MSTNARHAMTWKGRHGCAIRLGTCFLAVSLATGFVASIQRSVTPPLLLWISNGLLLSYFLVDPRWRWPAYLAVGFAAQWVASSVVNGQWKVNLVLALLNVFEVMVSAHLLRRRSTDLPQFTESRYLMRFAAFALVAGPAAAGAIFAPLASAWFHANAGVCFLSWVIGDGLGTAVTTPACVAVFRTHMRGSINGPRPWLYPALLVFITFAGFLQTRVPVLFLVYPLLVLILLQLGLAWAAMGALFVTVTGSFFTIHGLGPLLITSSLSHQAPILLLQLYIASGMLMLYSISIVLDRQKATEHRLHQVAALHRLVTENSRDAILIADFDGHPSFMSPAMQRITGWSPEEMARLGGLGVCHPEDRKKLELLASRLRKGFEEAMIEYRVLRPTGDYIWVEASLRPCIDPVTGLASGTLNIIRDISERKRGEQQLQAAYRTLEALAVTDPLTRLANRRRFDQCLSGEWRRALREHAPLSLLLIDVDMFKSYNDTYGHLRGDSCLKHLAETVQDVVTRPGDLVARFGGEEFAIVLPSTPNDGAMQLAELVCAAVRQRRLPHRGNPLGYLTISAGCATMAPQPGQHAAMLIQKADDALYAAKRHGRNRACNANAADRESAVSRVG
jgi:diguanylate cyclase (GGDEF)-like protein/PAS domain S-box-containing protein